MALVNTGNASRKEKSLYYNTLSGLVKNLENRYTTIDLRNECCVTGKIAKVDGFMNVEMEDVVFYDMRGRQKYLTSFFVCARTIRDILMPKNVDAMHLLQCQLESMSRKRMKEHRTFKRSRAIRNTTETLTDANKHSKSDKEK